MSKQQTNKLILLFSLAYMVSYITRTNLGAILVELERSTGWSKSLLSYAVTGSFITYGAGQIISGICGDRIQPKSMLLYGLLATAAANCLLPLCGDPYLMLAVWCVNGFAQSMMWPPLVRLMVSLFSDEEYARAMVVVGAGSSIGTILVYLVSPLIISLLSWHYVFWVSAAGALLMAFFWQKLCPHVPRTLPDTSSPSAKRSSVRGLLFAPVMLVIMLGIICQGALRDSVTTWTPSFLADTYHMSSTSSILTGVVLPIFSILCCQIASKVYRKTSQNPVRCGAVCFAIGMASAFSLALVKDQSVVGATLCAALLTGCMHAVNLFLISLVPKFFQRSGNVSTVSGVLNACSYVGSASSTYGIALASELWGWQTTVLLWGGIAAAGTLLCVLAMPGWLRQQKKLQ